MSQNFSAAKMADYFARFMAGENAPEFATTFLMSYENQSVIFNDILDVSGKDVLALSTGCGDYYFNSILYGANNVELFDISRWNYFGQILKTEIIRHCEYDEFISFSDNRNANFINTLTKVANHLPEVISSTFKIACAQGLLDRMFFSPTNKDLNIASKHNPYYKTRKNYKKLQKILPAKEPKFTCCDVRRLPQTSKKYDCILLSNLAVFVPLKKLIRCVSDALKPGGEILAFVDTGLHTSVKLKKAGLDFEKFDGFQASWFSFTHGLDDKRSNRPKTFDSISSLIDDASQSWERYDMALLLTRTK